MALQISQTGRNIYDVQYREMKYNKIDFEK